MGDGLLRYILRTCPGREVMAAYVVRLIPETEVVFDHQQDAQMCFLRALKLAGDDAVVHLEDDIVLTREFHRKLQAVVTDHGDLLCQFFSMRKADRTTGSRVEPGSKFLMAQCFYAPPGMSHAILDFWKVWPDKEKHPTGLDMQVADYLRSIKADYYVSIPSLVDHRVGKSIINPKRSSKRQSFTFVDPAK